MKIQANDRSHQNGARIVLMTTTAIELRNLAEKDNPLMATRLGEIIGQLDKNGKAGNERKLETTGRQLAALKDTLHAQYLNSSQAKSEWLNQIPKVG